MLLHTCHLVKAKHIEACALVLDSLYKVLHDVQMLDNVEGPVHHLAYERGEDVIVMKGYKFAKAKTAAAATLGCLALASSAVATQLVQVPTPSSLITLAGIAVL